MPETLFFSDCFLCKRSVQYGPHAYGLRKIRAWNIMVCHQCYGSNWDGLVPDQHPRLLEHLKNKGTQVKLNPRGWIDWPE
jgi:hypothetical protein